MFPRRFRNIRPYLASFIHSRFPRPPVSEIFQWITQPGKEQRASKFIESVADAKGMKEIRFKGFDKPLYYPNTSNWINLCQTIDECLNPKNWHYFITEETPINDQDIVVDCGAAEGLFSYLASFHAKQVYAVEPIPSWHCSMERTFENIKNVEILKYGVGHKKTIVKMTDDEMCSRISNEGNLEICIDTLDSLFAGKQVTFLKADVEGFEFPMLLGAENLIRQNRPKIAITVYHDGNDFIEMQQFLKNIHSDYQFKTRGIAENGNPILMLAF